MLSLVLVDNLCVYHGKNSYDQAVSNRSSFIIIIIDDDLNVHNPKQKFRSKPTPAALKEFLNMC